MAGIPVSDVITVAGVTVAGCGVLLGIPAWRAQRRANRLADLADQVRQVLVGHSGEVITDPAHPAIVDSLREIRESTAEVAWVSTALAWHMSDGHGGRMPQRPWPPH